MADENKNPEVVEIASSAASDNLLAPYIAAINDDPERRPQYAVSYRDEARILRTYRHTLRDERAMAALDQRIDAVISKPFEVQPGGDSPLDKQAAEDLARQFKLFDFDTVYRQMLFSIWYGYSVSEVLWRIEGDLVEIENIIVRSPDRFRFKTAGELLLRTRGQPMGFQVPDRKFIVLTQAGEHGDLPHGPGVARWCYWPIFLKRHGLQFWSTFLDKFGTPTSVGKYPPGAGDEEIKKLTEAMELISTSAGVAIPESTTIEILDAARSGRASYHEFVAYMDTAITTTILGQTATTDTGQWVGTAQIQKEVRDEVVASDARMADRALNITLSRWITEWNFPGAATPIIRRDVEPSEDLDARADREKTIYETTGYVPTLSEIERVYGGEWEPRPTTLPPGGKNAPSAPPARVVAQESESGDEITRAADDAADEWEELLDPILQPLIEVSEKSSSFEEFQKALPDAIRRSDDAPFIEALERRSFSARLSGVVGDTPNGHPEDSSDDG